MVNKRSDYNALAQANGLVTSRTPEGLRDQTYQMMYLQSVRDHGPKMIDALVVLTQLLVRDVAAARGVPTESVLQHYGIQFKQLETIAIE